MDTLVRFLLTVQNYCKTRIQSTPFAKSNLPLSTTHPLLLSEIVFFWYFVVRIDGGYVPLQRNSPLRSVRCPFNCASDCFEPLKRTKILLRFGFSLPILGWSTLAGRIISGVTISIILMKSHQLFFPVFRNIIKWG